MGSTSELDWKRCHFSSISSSPAATAATATAKKQPFAPLLEEKKLDVAVLQFQNQKLMQKLEAQKVLIVALRDKFSQLREKQQPYENKLAVVKKSWEDLVGDPESCSITTKDVVKRSSGVVNQLIQDDGASSPEDDFLGRLLQTGATDSSSSSNILDVVAEDKQTDCGKTNDILCNIVSATDYLWQSKDRLYTELVKTLPAKASSDLYIEVKNLRRVIGDLHLKHKSLACELQRHRDSEAKNKAELKSLREKLIWEAMIR